MRRVEKKYSDAIEWLNSLNQNKIVPGLERIAKLMNILENPQKKLKIIIIGGTNAKGSTCLNLNHNLTKNRLRIGCFTSPHIHSVRERIRIGKELINKDEFTDVLNLLREIVNENKIEATYFEILTAAAYQYFHNKNVNYAIMEVGLGGEWDAVNIGDAYIAILTTLGIDHVNYLGNELEGIAATKAKIVRKNSIVITGWGEKYHKYIPECQSLMHSDSIEKWVEKTINLIGIKQPVEIIDIPGRYEKVGNIILDTAHNTQAIQFLISKNKEYDKIIIGIMEDKDIESIIGCLPKSCEILVCNLETERSVGSDKLATVCQNLGYNYRKFNNVKQAMEYSKNHKTLITGSFYTVSEAREYLKLEGHSEL